ncbi:MAG: hypothetical protein IT254_04665 [Chitinophagaceae bacterium]|nr:hypothetical protein [Bacteroidota bacterium]MCC6257592.1 hypothetical protein [Chitinophagaceae bacterium]MCW5915944.1 hypothetical protein [Ferruginibacter sp.]
MKTLLLLMGTILFALAGNSQPNNPYNKRGADFQTSLKIIQTDYYAGKVKEINEETIAKYQKVLPIQLQMNLPLANQVINTYKSPKTNYGNLVEKTKLSGFGKELMNVIVNPQNLDEGSFKRMLEKKVDELKTLKIDTNEKEFLFTVAAIGYNMPMGREPIRQCFIEGIYGNTPVPCWVSGAVQGAIIGYESCGVLCAIGGAIVGALSGWFS